MKRVAFYTLGCKVNRYDTEAMMAQFEKKGHQIVDFSDEADVYIINTCTVTHQGASKSRKMIRRVKRRTPMAIIGVVGCYPQVDAEEVLKIEGIDFVLGTKGRDKIVSFVQQAAKAKKPINFVQGMEEEEAFEELKIDNFKTRTRANVKIQEGCTQFCSYCIIPYARGPLRSRGLDDVKKEVRRLAKHGFKEIVLTGIHLGEYGAKQEDLNLFRLLQEILPIEGIERIRLSSIEGTEVSEELIDLIAESDKLCPHLHLPLQSGSDKILKAMNRPYNIDQFKAMLKKIRAKVPEIAITTDIIVGFPGESEEDFEDTLKTVRELEFSDGHIFKYSKRSGTPAATFSEQVHSKVKKKRSKKLREVVANLADDYKKKFIAKELKVLLEEQRDKASGLLTGLTDNYLRVFVDGDDSLAGGLIKTKLVEKEGKLIGELEINN